MNGTKNTELLLDQLIKKKLNLKKQNHKYNDSQTNAKSLLEPRFKKPQKPTYRQPNPTASIRKQTFKLSKIGENVSEPDQGLSKLSIYLTPM